MEFFKRSWPRRERGRPDRPSRSNGGPDDRVTPVSLTRLTTDRSDPRLSEIDPATKMQMTYVVLSDEERAKGYVRPVRRRYIHEVCGVVTTMGAPIAETYARDPNFYGATYCAGCKAHFPVGAHGEFLWDGTTEKVGT